LILKKTRKKNAKFLNLHVTSQCLKKSTKIDDGFAHHLE